MNGMKIMCMGVEHLVFLDSVSFVPFALHKLPDAFGLTVAKSWYPRYFNTRANLKYVGKIPDIYYDIDEMSASERNEFLAWYEGQKIEVFDNRRVLESYCQDDVNVLREACRELNQKFIQIGNNDSSLCTAMVALGLSTYLEYFVRVPTRPPYVLDNLNV